MCSLKGLRQLRRRRQRFRDRWPGGTSAPSCLAQVAGRASDFSVQCETHTPRNEQNITQTRQKTANFMQDFRAPRLRIGAAPLPWSPRTAENRRPSAGFLSYFGEIRADFARFQGVVFAGFWPVGSNSVSIAGWQSDELTE